MQQPSPREIFEMNAGQFDELALRIFRFQAENNPVYAQYLRLMSTDVDAVTAVTKIPFLPIQFFKSHTVVSAPSPYEAVFTSSGTTGARTSRHYVKSLDIYHGSFTAGFRHFYGKPEDYIILALLPSYLGREGSSLILMTKELIEAGGNPESGFFLDELDELRNKLEQLDKQGKKILLLGVTYALLDLAEKGKMQLQNTIIMETGGMKGKRKEIVRAELHEILCEAFGVKTIHSEYGMTELLSQAYSSGKGIFRCPPWMGVLVRDVNDPREIIETGKTGGLNMIDLANIYSCSFIATQDLGKIYADNSFEVAGRFDSSDIRGCNLLI